MSSDAGEVQYWAMALGYSDYYGVRDHVLCLGFNRSQLGARVDASKAAVSVNIECGYVDTDGGNPTSEIHFPFTAPDGTTVRSYMATFDWVTHRTNNFLRGATYLYDSETSSEHFVFENGGRFLLAVASSSIVATFNASSWLLQHNSAGSPKSLAFLDATNIWRFDPDAQGVKFGGNVGFYGTIPIAKPTGVAVTAAGIHAALVSLGLIAA